MSGKGDREQDFTTERRWRWFGRAMLGLMALALLAITLLAQQ